MAGADVVATGLALPEGPVLLPAGGIAFGEQGRGRISTLDGGHVTTLARTGGSPNGLTLGADGWLYVAQNGGVEGDWRSDDPVEPGIQRVSPDGVVERVATVIGGRRLLAPNDLCFGPDHRLWVTDPAHPFDPVERGTTPGALVAMDGGDGEVVLEVGHSYPNGVGLRPDGRLLWVESYERHVCALVDGRRQELCRLPPNHVPDGFAVATDGRMFIATVTSHAITVIAPDGALVDVIELDGRAKPTNCCFDGSALWVTDFGADHPHDRSGGRLWRVETDAVGLPLRTGVAEPQHRSIGASEGRSGAQPSDRWPPVAP